MFGRAALVRGLGALFGLVVVLAMGLIGCERSKTTKSSASAAPSAPVSESGGCVVQLTSSETYTCALLSSGQARCWGLQIPMSNEYGNIQPITLLGFPRRLSRLFVDRFTVCAGTEDGSLWCGGASSRGQLTHTRTEAPTKQPQQQPFSDVTHVTPPGRCLLTKDGLHCWEHGSEPVPISGLPAKPSQVVGGIEYACALLENGEVYCRGSNLRGQLGILEGATEEERTNSRISKYGFTRVKALGDDTRLIAAGLDHSCALKRDGSVWCWGQNDAGQIGKGDISTCTSKGAAHWLLSSCTPEEGLVPTRVGGLPADVDHLSLGARTSCAIDGRGDAWCWGYLNKPTPLPVKLAVGAPVTMITLGEDWCALLRDGRVRCRDEQPFTDWSEARTIELGCR